MWKQKALAYSELAFLALFIALVLSFTGSRTTTEQIASTEIFATTTQVAFFPQVEIEARSAYVYDTVTKQALYEKDAELQLPLASLTKLMSAVTAWDIVPEYMLVRISPEDMLEEGDSGLSPDEEWNVRKLIDFMLVVSSNDGAKAIASAAGSQILDKSHLSPQERFVEAMNAKAQEIGLRETFFLNQSGLDMNTHLAGAYGSAKDMTLLIDYIMKENPHLLEATTFETIELASKNTYHEATNTNKAILSVPNILGSKTGFTDLSGGNVVVAWNAGIDHPIIISILGSSYDGRFEDLSKLVDATTRYFSNSTTTVAR